MIKIYDVFTVENIKITAARIYKPIKPPIHIGADIVPKFFIGFDHADEFLTLGEHVMHRKGSHNLFSSHSLIAPVVDCVENDYLPLIAALDIARARNIDPDFLFKGLSADIRLQPYEMNFPKRETVLKFAPVSIQIDADELKAAAVNYQNDGRKERP